MIMTHRREAVRATQQITIVNKLGLHARPAAQFVRRANAFRSEIWIVTKAGRFSALSLIDVMRANLDCGAGCGDPCNVHSTPGSSDGDITQCVCETGANPA
jgi:phosphotransferase system HPr (HPr) family protein